MNSIDNFMPSADLIDSIIKGSQNNGYGTNVDEEDFAKLLSKNDFNLDQHNLNDIENLLQSWGLEGKTHQYGGTFDLSKLAQALDEAITLAGGDEGRLFEALNVSHNGSQHDDEHVITASDRHLAKDAGPASPEYINQQPNDEDIEEAPPINSDKEPSRPEEEQQPDKPASGGGAQGVYFSNYEKLSNEITDFDNVEADYLVYVESHGRNGHNDINANQKGFVDVQGAELLGYGGGRDKYIALFKINSADISIDKNGGSAQVFFINSDKDITVAEAQSIDPSIGKEKVEGASGSIDYVIYAEDEGGKGTRDEFYKPRAQTWFGGGDDLAYIFSNNAIDNQGPNGNGAYMKLRVD